MPTYKILQQICIDFFPLTASMKKRKCLSTKSEATALLLLLLLQLQNWNVCNIQPARERRFLFIFLYMLFSFSLFKYMEIPSYKGWAKASHCMEATGQKASIPEDVQPTIWSTLVDLTIPELSSLKYIGSEDWQDLGRLGCVPKGFKDRQVVGFRPICIKLPVILPENQQQNCSGTAKSYLNGGAVWSKAD